MKLIWIGKEGQYITGVPARDLEAHEVQKIAHDWQLSLAETEGLLIQRGLYKTVADTTGNVANVQTTPKKKTAKKVAGE